MTILKAGLNRAVKDKTAAPSTEWANCEPFPDVNQPRLRYFTRDEVTRLLNAAQGDFRNLCKAALFSGCRLGDLTRLVVGDFNLDTGTLFNNQRKTGAALHVVLTPEGVRFFTSLAAGRAGSDLMLTKNGVAWSPTGHASPMNKSMEAASVEHASFHVWRHTSASHWLMGGVAIAVVSRNLGNASIIVTERPSG